MLKKIYFFLIGAVILLAPFAVSAHENYVLTKPEIDADIAYRGLNVLDSLKQADNLTVAITVAAISLLAALAYYLVFRSRCGQNWDRRIAKLEPFGHAILRIALAASLIFSAYTNSFLGPEIPLASLPLGWVLRPILYILGILLLVGLWSEWAGFASLIVLLLATWVYKDYMLTYVNYLGEFLALAYFGSRLFSVDRLLKGVKKKVEQYHNWEVALIRVTYGISVMYPAITFKLLHPEVIVDIVHRYNLTKFHWLFPHDPLLIALGGGLAQVVVGLCLVVGFETRLNTFITFFLMMLSVMYFKETVWPHFILLALALYLMINNGGKYGLDYRLVPPKNTA